MKRNLLKAGLIFGAALTLGGCSGAASFSPKGASFGADYAELVFELGVANTVSLGSATNQQYRISDTASWNAGRLVKIFTWAAKSPKTVLLGAGKRIYVFAQMDRMYGAPGITSSGNNTCMNGSAFTPQANTRYRIVQTGSAYGACNLAITDLTTGNEAEGVEPVLFPIPAVTK
jgi:hypothetical protein